MKKFLIIVVVLAGVLLLSPGVIGGMAEKQVQETVEWTASRADESGVEYRSESFEKGWFSSLSVDRLLISDPAVQAELVEAFGLENADALPQLVITTRLDHGLIPLTSLSRDGGTLMPSLGSTVSTARVELGNGESVDLPGEAYGVITLGGVFDSSYDIEAGSTNMGQLVAYLVETFGGDEMSPEDLAEADAMQFSWGDTSIRSKLDTKSGRVSGTGTSDGFSLESESGFVKVGAMRVDADQTPSQYGFNVGDFDMEFASVSVKDMDTPDFEMGPMTIKGTSSITGERVSGDTQVFLAMSDVPNFGPVSLTMDISMQDLQGEPFGDVIDTLNAVDDDIDPGTLYAVLGPDLETLVSRGFSVDIRQLDVALPQGTVDTSLSVTVPETDATPFSWGGILKAMNGQASLSIPAPLMDMVFAMNPQAQAAVAMGFLRLNGDNYEMEALYEQGLLTVNGAPFPVPLPP